MIMEIKPSKQQISKPWFGFMTFKPKLMGLILVTLLVSNVASVFSANVHDWMHSVLWRIISLGGHALADRALINSPKTKRDLEVKRKTADIDAQNKQLRASNDVQLKKLDAAQLESERLAKKLEVSGKRAKETVAVVHKRIAKSISRNVAALPSEAIPYVGIGVAVAVTSMDIVDACQTMKDFNELLVMLGQGEEKPDLCGQKVPTVDQVVLEAKSKWRTIIQQIADEAKALKVTPPQVRLPSREEVAKAACAAGAVPYLCLQ